MPIKKKNVSLITRAAALVGHFMYIKSRFSTTQYRMILHGRDSFQCVARFVLLPMLSSILSLAPPSFKEYLWRLVPT